MSDILWNNEDPINDLEIEDLTVPDWIDSDIDPSTVAAIIQGGCASGAYMPAVTYHEAIKTMSEYGDDVLDFIVDRYDELPKPDDSESWSGMAVFYLSCAVEAWAVSVEEEVCSALEETDDEETTNPEGA